MNTSSSTIRSSEGDVPISDEIEKNTSRPVVLQDKYTGDEDWLDWLTHFELCTKTTIGMTSQKQHSWLFV